VTAVAVAEQELIHLSTIK